MTRTNCIVEEDIYNILGDILEEDDVVLEVLVGKVPLYPVVYSQIGSRYGAVSCALSEVMGNNGKLVTVEADPDVWAMHQVRECSSIT